MRCAHTGEDTRQLSMQCMCAHVLVNILCVAFEITFIKEFTFQIESTS